MAPIMTKAGLLLALCASRVLAAPKADAKPTVSIADGVVIGTATRVANQPENTALVNSYLGIPFAASPPLRFAPPTKPKPWTKPLAAQKNPPACLQMFMSGDTGARTRAVCNNPGGPPPPESEDCLYLNVFAPKDASPKKLKPVMFWIFGGNLAFGTASLTFYNGSYLAANQDVVVVAANYRTNMFGFSNSPELPKGQQNAGYLDQRFALQWVQDNIAKFGGDPTKVTLFGESAGGYSIRDLLAHPPYPLPFRAAILESQGQLAVPGPSYDRVSANFGCTTAPSPINCLRKIPGTEIRDYISNNSISFSPTDDGITHSNNVLPQIQSGQFADVPILMGTNKDEGRLFAWLAGLGSPDTTFTSYLDPSNLTTSPAQRAAIQAAYPSLASTPYLLASQIITDLVFTCRTSALSNAITGKNTNPVWRYRFDAAFPNVSPFPDAGAYHSVEIPTVWGTYPLQNEFGKATGDQIQLAKYLTGVWGGFAKEPGRGPGWGSVGSMGGRYLGLLGGEGNRTGGETVNILQADGVCAVYFPVLLAANFAY